MTTPTGKTAAGKSPAGKSIDEIMACIKKEAQTNTRDDTEISDASRVLADVTINTEPVSSFSPQLKESYVVDDFLQYHDKVFIKTAYLSLLGRLPDSQGQASYLAKLQNFDYTKTEILGRLRYSREGRRKKVSVKGLLLPFVFQLFYRIPFLGRALRIITGLWNLPLVLKNIRKIERLALVETDRVSELKGDLNRRFALKVEVAKSFGAVALKTEVAESLGAVALKAEVEEGLAALGKLAETLADKGQLLEISRQTRDHKLNIIDMQRRIQFFLEEARKRLPEPFSPEQLKTIVQEEDHLCDAMYVSFEDKFRGTRQDIKERVKEYLPVVEKALVKTHNARVLDVGCGRGEWLEVLKENNINALGLDLNRIMVAQCQDRGFEVMESDVITYLRGLAENSLGVITGFHIIEHLPLKTFIALLDESFRVLKPGGLILFETPNPENVLVGAHYFYTDPTHLNPLVPSSIQFIVEQRGFSRVEIRRLHKYSDYHTITDGDDFKNKHMYNEMDFAVIGSKA